MVAHYSPSAKIERCYLEFELQHLGDKQPQSVCSEIEWDLKRNRKTKRKYGCKGFAAKKQRIILLVE